MSGYLVFDTETSGLFNWSMPADAEGQPRLASIALLQVDEDFEIERRWYRLIRPDGWEMSAEVTAINGLSTENLQREGVGVVEALEEFWAMGASHGVTHVAHNLSFDAKVMRGEMRRAGFSDQIGPGICTMVGLTQFCGIPGPRGLKWPKLEEACDIVLNRKLTGAHNALVDAKACLWLLRAMVERGLLPKKAEAA